MKRVLNEIMDVLLRCALLGVLVRSQSTRIGGDGASTGNKQSKAGRFPTADTTVALEGNCVVVCDAVQSQSRQTFASTSGSRRVAFAVQQSASLGRPGRRGANGEREEFVTITFDHIVMNIGNGYDARTSTFIAPTSGVYALDFNIYKFRNRNTLTVVLTINDVAFLTAFANANTATQELAHNSALAHLFVKDRVKLQIVEGTLDGGWQFSTFSGHLLYEERF